MAKNDNSHALWFLDSMTKHGQQEAGQRFAEEHPLEESADFDKEFAWAKHVCAFMEENYDDETVKEIRMDCACGPQYGKEELRAIYEKEKDPNAFVEKVSSLGLGFWMEYDGTDYYMIYPECYCPCVKDNDELLSKAWCYCTAGYNKRLFEGVFDAEVQAELISSIKMGDDCCRIRIHILEKDASANN